MSYFFPVTQHCCLSFGPAWHAAASTPPNALQRQQDSIFYNPLNQIRTICTAYRNITDAHNYVSGRNGKPAVESGWDSPGGNLWVSPPSLCEWDPVQKGKLLPLLISKKLSLLINTLKRWWTRNNYHWQNCVCKALVWKELPAADELVLISQCWGSYDQFINNKGQLPFEPWLDNTLMLLYICAWKEEITLLLSPSCAPLLHLLISCHPPAVHYQGLPSAGDG